MSDSVQSRIRGRQTGGRGLDDTTRHFMESRFDADFGAVRVHDDAESARLSNQLGARAFTTGHHVFFGADQFRPGTSQGRHLLAHELTHTLQQGATIQRSPQVSTSAAPPAIQRFGLGDALNYFADKANVLPGFRMLTIVLGSNPINRAPADRSAGNILRALIELVPGGSLITSALENHGVVRAGRRLGRAAARRVREHRRRDQAGPRCLPRFAELERRPRSRRRVGTRQGHLRGADHQPDQLRQRAWWTA